MNTTVRKDLADLAKMSTGQLQGKYRELFGSTARSFNRQWLYRRCAWRLQALAEGDMTERVKRLRERALAIADDADVRVVPPRAPTSDATCPHQVGPIQIKQDNRLPVANTTLERPFKGRLYEVKVLPNGFEFDGEIYQSLSAVAHKITGCHWNGYHFFRKALLDATNKQEVA